MISLELSTIQQNSQAQDWLSSLPGYVAPDLEGLNSAFRPPYLPVRTVVKRTPRKRPHNVERAAQEAVIAEQIRALVERGLGISAICAELAMDTRRVRRIAAQYQVEIPIKNTFRKEAV